MILQYIGPVQSIQPVLFAFFIAFLLVLVLVLSEAVLVLDLRAVRCEDE